MATIGWKSESAYACIRKVYTLDQQCELQSRKAVLERTVKVIDIFGNDTMTIVEATV